MKSPDPASLQNLNDIVLPEPVHWWPLASGWYVLMGLLLVILVWLIQRSIKSWMNNSYRRAALSQLKLLTEDIHNDQNRDSALRKIPVLLKRTALSVYPRRQLASLTGNNWYDFLNTKVDTPVFSGIVTDLLDKISYSVSELQEVHIEAQEQLLKACNYWIKHHRPAIHPLQDEKP